MSREREKNHRRQTIDVGDESTTATTPEEAAGSLATNGSGGTVSAFHPEEENRDERKKRQLIQLVSQSPSQQSIKGTSRVPLGAPAAVQRIQQHLVSFDEFLLRLPRHQRCDVEAHQR